MGKNWTKKKPPQPKLQYEFQYNFFKISQYVSVSKAIPAVVVLIGVILFSIYWAKRPEVVDTLVIAKDGRLRGIRAVSQRNKVNYISYRGIPYAKPPIGDLRFKAPEPVGEWEGIYFASEHSFMCIQPGVFYQDPYPQDEDCLSLNIYVPDKSDKPDEKFAVMFYIHGGSYVEGSGNEYNLGPDFFIENQVILVTCNYRLGPLGFLAFGLPDYSGNMGLKDQQLALKWVHRNIMAFGGDRTRITIFGESAGGSSTHLQLLSSKSRRFFRNAIMMSGAALNYWAISPLANHVDVAYEMAADWKSPQRNIPALVDYLKKVPAEKFNEYSNTSTEGLVELIIGPVVEESDALSPFMTESPEEIYIAKNINRDILFGIVSQECLGMCQPSKKIKDKFEFKLPFKGLRMAPKSRRYKEIQQEIMEFYYQNASLKDKTDFDFAPFLSDVNFVYLVAKSALIHAMEVGAHSYMYHFGVESRLNLIKELSELTGYPGTMHGDELSYLFRSKYAQEFYDEMFEEPDTESTIISLRTIEEFTKLFTNFAKHGKPIFSTRNENLHLPAFESESLAYVDITNDGLQLKKDFRRSTVEFWADIERRAYE